MMEGGRVVGGWESPVDWGKSRLRGKGDASSSISSQRGNAE